ncbi:MAG: hypothetical protein LRS43_03105 [Desulfurococcales archaeon]|nr:hypothetical protein [Desulfurococcales archaeon]
MPGRVLAVSLAAAIVLLAVLLAPAWRTAPLTEAERSASEAPSVAPQPLEAPGKSPSPGLTEEERRLIREIALSHPIVRDLIERAGGYTIIGYTVVTKDGAKVGGDIGFELSKPVWFSGEYTSMYGYRAYDLRAYVDAVSVYVNLECMCVKGIHLSEADVPLEEALNMLEPREARLVENLLEKARNHPEVRELYDKAGRLGGTVTVEYEGLYYKPEKALSLEFRLEATACSQLLKILVDHEGRIIEASKSPARGDASQC